MYQQDVVFLNAGGARMGDVEQNVGVFEYGGDFAAVAAGQGDDVHIAFVCRFNGLMTLAELPEVEMPTRMSPARPRARTCLLKTWLKP